MTHNIPLHVTRFFPMYKMKDRRAADCEESICAEKNSGEISEIRLYRKLLRFRIMYRRGSLQDCEGVYRLICEMEEEALPYGIFKEIYEENIRSGDHIFLIWEEEMFPRE